MHVQFYWKICVMKRQYHQPTIHIVLYRLISESAKRVDLHLYTNTQLCKKMASCECELCSVAWKEWRGQLHLGLNSVHHADFSICGQTSTMLSIDNITFNTLQGSASDQVYPSLVRLSLRVGKNSLSIMHLCRSIFSDFVHLSICIAACDHKVEVCFSVSWSISCSSYLLFIP